MLVIALTARLVLAQEDPAPQPAEPAPAAAPGAAEPSAAPAAGGPSGSGGTDPAITAMRRAQEELARTAAKVRELGGEERAKSLEDIRKRSVMPVLPPREFDIDAFWSLNEAEQASVIARGFFEAMLSGDAGRVVDYTGLPFMLEDKKIERPDELRSTWAKHLRSKRTDLIALYGLETLTASEMEKKYGQPPARLRNWPWRQSQQFIAVGNMSGRSAVVLLRSVGSTWQVIGYHD